MNIKSLFILPYLLLLVVGLMLPSTAQHGILSPKSLSFFGAIGGCGFHLFLRQKLFISHLKIILFLFASLTFLLLWLFISQVNDVEPISVSMDQFKIFVITLMIPIMSIYLIKEKLISSQTILRTVIYANTIYCATKVVVCLLHFAGVIDLWSIYRFLGVRFMTTSIFEGVYRFQSSVDISTPFIVLFVFQSDKLGLRLSPRFRYFYIFVSFLSNLISFSRFLLLVYLVSFALYIFTLSLRRMVHCAIIASLFLMAAILAIGVGNVITSIEQRFFSEENFRSDYARYEQVEALLLEHDQYPYFGKGVGGYAENLLRDSELKHSYEVQWVAFLMQFGLFGLLCLIIPIAIISFKFIMPPFSRDKLAFMGLFGLWLLSGFTNPFLISLQSGIIYALFFIAPTALANVQTSRKFNA